MKSDETLPKTINAKILKEVQPKEMTSSVKVPTNAQPASGNSLREVPTELRNTGNRSPIYKNL